MDNTLTDRHMGSRFQKLGARECLHWSRHHYRQAVIDVSSGPDHSAWAGKYSTNTKTRPANRGTQANDHRPPIWFLRHGIGQVWIGFLSNTQKRKSPE